MPSLKKGLSKIGSTLFGTAPSAKFQTMPNYDPQQMAMFNSMGTYLQGQIGKLPEVTEQGKRYQNFLGNYKPWAQNITQENFDNDTKATEQYMTDVALPQWDKYTAPQVREGFSGGDYWGSARKQAVTDSLAGVQGTENQTLYNMDLQRQTALDELMQSEPAMAQELINNWDRYNDWIKSPAGQAMLDYLTLKPYSTQWHMDPGKKGLATPLLTAGGGIIGGMAGGPMGAVAGAQIGNTTGNYFQK